MSKEEQRPTLTTTQVAQRAGVHQSTVRKYEELGYIRSERVGPGRFRLFPADAIEVVRRVRKQNETPANARSSTRA
jgi:excisionase family DNA binding protein